MKSHISVSIPNTVDSLMEQSTMLFMMLGSGYSSFVIDEEKENYLSLTELGL